MEELLEILKYTLPSIVVFGTAYYLIKMMVDNEQRRRQQDIVMANQKTITPIRLQAYERVVLFLERISPNSLLIRLQKPSMKSRELHKAMLETIRMEFEHNLSQQVYLSNDAWSAVVSAKENMVKLINSIAGNMKKEATAMDLSKKIVEVLMQVDSTPTSVALEIVKKEFREITGRQQ